MANKIAVVSLGRFEKFEKNVKKSALEILKILNKPPHQTKLWHGGKEGAAVEIYLAGDKLMQRLNKEYRGKDKSANVLSFVEPTDFPHPETKAKFLGEIYLNLTNNQQPTTNNSCKLSVVSCKLLIHAVLHLFGYTHKRKSDRIKMEKKEQYVYHRFRHRNISNKGFNRRDKKRRQIVSA